MPGRDQTGPFGTGPLGQRRGNCPAENAVSSETNNTDSAPGPCKGQAMGFGKGLGKSCRQGAHAGQNQGAEKGVGHGSGQGRGRCGKGRCCGQNHAAKNA